MYMKEVIVVTHTAHPFNVFRFLSIYIINGNPLAIRGSYPLVKLLLNPTKGTIDSGP